MKIEQIAESLRDTYNYFLVPKAVLDTPIQLSGMAKEDKNGDLTGEHYSINEIHLALGNQFTFIPVIDDRFVAFRWAVDRDGTEAKINKYLADNNLVDIRVGQSGNRLYTDEIDFESLPDNAFALFDILNFKKVSKFTEGDI